MSKSACGGANGSNDSEDKEFLCRSCGVDRGSRQALYDHYRSNANDCTGFECPTCGVDYLTCKEGVNRHRASQHGNNLRLVTVNCMVCGEEYEKEPHHVENTTKNYCSKECQAIDLKREAVVVCEVCNEERVVSPPSSASRFCSKKCMKEVFKGETHPCYKGGKNYYGEDWNRMRRKARERDGHQCQVCGKDKSDLGMHPHVHHVRPVKDFEDPNDAHYLENLITLCPKHHHMYEGTYLKPQIV